MWSPKNSPLFPPQSPRRPIFSARLRRKHSSTRQTWTKLPAFARVIPDGDVLPTRAKYSLESNDYQVGLNHLYATSDDPKDGLWFALPDLAASVLLTGRVPRSWMRFASCRRGSSRASADHATRRRADRSAARRLLPHSHRGAQAPASNAALSDEERQRLDKALKVLANATSYGIFAEMIREESAEKVAVTCYGIDPKPFDCRVLNPEHPGEYCFPPLASLITAAARLMLALLERCVTDFGGTYAMEDTDSMAIVATQRGGLIEFPGGPYRRNGKPAIRPLSWAQVDAIAEALRRAESLRSQPRSPARFSRSRTTTSIPRPGGNASCGAWRFPPSAMRSSFAIRSGSRRCCARASITKRIGTPSMASGICSIPPIPRATIAAGSRRLGSTSCADRSGCRQSRWASRSA